MHATWWAGRPPQHEYALIVHLPNQRGAIGANGHMSHAFYLSLSRWVLNAARSESNPG